jgi:non-specific serine/threonine protein kinase
MTPSLSRLVGREQEIDLAASLLGRQDIRLLTLTGPGGIGKTRLSIEIAERMAPAFADGAHVVQLADVPHAGLVTAAVAQSLGLREQGSADLLDLLKTALHDAHLLLVIDNFEHVENAAPLVTVLLAACPRLKVLATSRSLLRLTGEHVLPVPPLAVPDPESVASREDVASSAAVQLFLDRARAVAPSFALTDSNAEIIADICRRLDGLPLAIELAATQSAVLPPAALLNRIGNHLPMPLGGPVDAPERHQTVRQAIAWSYDLLPPDEQQVFRYSGVFVGGFGVDAAEHLSRTLVQEFGASTAPARDVLVDLAFLVNKSLLRQAAWHGTARFTMLETIRDFALEQLEAYGEREGVSEAHAEWCLELAEQSRYASIMPGGEEQLARIEVEHANIRAALEWLSQRRDSVRLLRLASAMGEFWYEHTHYREGSVWLERALASAGDVPGPERARALVELGHLLSLLKDSTRARAFLEEGLVRLRDAGDMTTVVLGLIWQGAEANHSGHHDDAERLLDEALGLATKLPNPQVASAITARVLANLGTTAHARGDLDVATGRFRQALDICREHGYVLGIARSLRDLGDVARDQGDFEESLMYYRESLALLGEQSDLRVVIDALEGTALAAVRWNHPGAAARLMGAAEVLGERLGAAITIEPDRMAHDRTIAAIRASLPDVEWQAAWSRGRSLTVAQAVAEVQTFEPADEGLESPAVAHEIRLTSREKDVLLHLVAGLSDREIAEALFLSVRTVEAHVTRLRAKLGVRTRTAAVAFAIISGLVDSSQRPPD